MLEASIVSVLCVALGCMVPPVSLCVNRVCQQVPDISAQQVIPHPTLSERRSLFRQLQTQLPLLARRQLSFVSTCAVLQAALAQPSPHGSPMLGLKGLFITLLDTLVVGVRVVLKS